MILRRLGAPDGDVLVGPRHGVDVGVVRVAPGVVMALTADPVFVVPAYGWERAAWFAVHILASDAATSGLPLRWMAVDLNLPPEISDDDLTSLWDAYSRACADLGIAVVTGHTARYDGCAWPMVGGAVCTAIGSEDAYVTPTMARPGDAIVVTKGAAIEATALFAATFPDRLADGVGSDVVKSADALFEQMTVVPEARAAASFG
ncbi:MAG: AIR synthase related protein, partial [Actinomycetota bacterium]|nr:AIR synthase related protein [Actinomycetota bacterium]